MSDSKRTVSFEHASTPVMDMPAKRLAAMYEDGQTDERLRRLNQINDSIIDKVADEMRANGAEVTLQSYPPKLPGAR